MEEIDLIKLGEYTALRQEILSNSTIIAQVFTVTITVVVTIIGLGLRGESKSGGFFFLVYGILIPSLLFIYSQLESTLRIATYINVFLEQDNPGLWWESCLNQFRQEDIFLPRKTPDWLYTNSIASLYVLLGTVSTILGVYYTFMEVKFRLMFKSILVTIASMCLLAYIFVLALDFNSLFGEEYISQCLSAWREIKGL